MFEYDRHGEAAYRAARHMQELNYTVERQVKSIEELKQARQSLSEEIQRLNREINVEREARRVDSAELLRIRTKKARAEKLIGKHVRTLKDLEAKIKPLEKDLKGYEEYFRSGGQRGKGPQVFYEDVHSGTPMDYNERDRYAEALRDRDSLMSRVQYLKKETLAAHEQSRKFERLWSAKTREAQGLQSTLDLVIDELKRAKVDLKDSDERAEMAISGRAQEARRGQALQRALDQEVHDLTLRVESLRKQLTMAEDDFSPASEIVAFTVGVILALIVFGFVLYLT
jgi:chromosome segregation ATPase